jgi:hypothetical protein
VLAGDDVEQIVGAQFRASESYLMKRPTTCLPSAVTQDQDAEIAGNWPDGLAFHHLVSPSAVRNIRRLPPVGATPFAWSRCYTVAYAVRASRLTN